MPPDPSPIRHLATSPTGSILAAAEFERIIHLYDLRTQQHLLTFDTTLDFGGRRLAISNDGRTVVAGAYLRHGIAAYSGHDGRELWRRRDLKKVQHITLTSNDAHALCCFDRGPCESLNTSTGKSAQPLRDVRQIWESPFAPVRLLEGPRGYALADREAPTVPIPLESFGILSAAFSQTLACISEAGASVRAFDTSSGIEAWRHTPPKGTHFLRVGFDETAGMFTGVSWPYERGGPKVLHRFSPIDGSTDVIADIGSPAETEFCAAGSKLVSSDGSLFDVPTGRLLGTLPFPARSRPAR